MLKDIWTWRDVYPCEGRGFFGRYEKGGEECTFTEKRGGVLIPNLMPREFRGL